MGIVNKTSARAPRRRRGKFVCTRAVALQGEASGRSRSRRTTVYTKQDVPADEARTSTARWNRRSTQSTGRRRRPRHGDRPRPRRVEDRHARGRARSERPNIKQTSEISTRSTTAARRGRSGAPRSAGAIASGGTTHLSRARRSSPWTRPWSTTYQSIKSRVPGARCSVPGRKRA